MVEVADIKPPQLAQKLSVAQLSRDEMGMIKADHRDAPLASGRDRLPRQLVGIARFDQIRLLTFQNLIDLTQIQQSAIARSARNERRMNRIESRPFRLDHFGLCSGHDQDMYIVSLRLDVLGILVQITFHSSSAPSVE